MASMKGWRSCAFRIRARQLKTCRMPDSPRRLEVKIPSSRPSSSLQAILEGGYNVGSPPTRARCRFRLLGRHILRWVKTIPPRYVPISSRLQYSQRHRISQCGVFGGSMRSARGCTRGPAAVNARSLVLLLSKLPWPPSQDPLSHSSEIAHKSTAVMAGSSFAD